MIIFKNLILNTKYKIQNTKFKPYILAIVSCVLITALGITFMVWSSPGTTTIGENISTTDLTASGAISLPNNSITDVMVVDTITASNYLPLSGGTITGDLTVDNTISEGGALLSAKYLGILEKAADADKLDNQDSAYFTNASNLASGTVPLARISGNYSNITGLGAVASGAWQGTAIGNDYIETSIDAAKLADGSVSNTKFQYLNGVSSGLQTQIYGKISIPGSSAQGDILFRNATEDWTRLGAGNSGEFLKTQGGTADPVWSAVSTTYARAATKVVCASDSLDTTNCDYVCDGTADDVEIQAALDAATGGRVILLDGTFNTIVNITVPATSTLEGQGFNTTVMPAGAAITNGIILNGNDIRLANFKIDLADGCGTGGARPNVVYATGRNHLLIENMFVVGDETVADDGSEVRQNGILFDNVDESKIRNVWSEDNDRHGINLYNGSDLNEVIGCSCNDNTWNGIYLDTSSNNTVTGNTCVDNDSGDTNTYDGIQVSFNGDYNLIEGNKCYVTTPGAKQRYGININAANCNGNIVWDNDLLQGGRTAPFSDLGTGTIYFSPEQNIAMDVLAISATHVVDDWDVSAAGEIELNPAAGNQPDYPRTPSWTFVDHTNVTEYDLVFEGVDAKGNSITETFTEADLWAGEVSNAFATISAIKYTRQAGAGDAGNIFDIGITDVLGLSNVIYATGDVFKIKKNNQNVAVAGAQVNTTYDTYDMSVIGLAGGDDYLLIFKANRNRIK